LNTRLQTRFFLAFVGLTIALDILAGVLGVWLIQRAARSDANAALTLHLQAVTGTFDALQHEWLLLSETLGSGLRVARACADPGSPTTIRELEAIRRQAGFDLFLLTDLKGRVTTRTTSPYRTGDVLTDEPVRVALQGTSWTGFVVLRRDRLPVESDDVTRRLDPETAEDVLALVVATPAYGHNGEQAGALVVGIVVNGSPLLHQRLRSLTVAGEAAPAVVASVYLEGAEVLTTMPAASGPADSPLPRPARSADRAAPGHTIWFGTKDTHAGRYLVAVAALAQPHEGGEGADASLSVGLPEARFAALRRSLALWYGGVGLAGALVAVIISLRLARRLARPIDRLAHAAGEVASGSFGLRLDEPRAHDEVWALTAAFNRMSEALGQRDAKLAAAYHDLKTVNASLSALNESYLNMLGFVSHELKNVLGTMNWSVLALEGGTPGTLSGPQARLVGALRTSLDGALAMTRSFLDLARIETGQLKLDLAACDVAADVARVVIDEFGNESARRSMRIESALPDTLPLTGDVNLLRVVLRNLVGNALRYGRSGGAVKLTCVQAGAYARCEVWNEGEGLQPEQVAQLFGKFRRFRSGRRDGPRGSGLGLFIVREIVQRHGGTVTAESEYGSWMRFVVRLPLSGPDSAGDSAGDIATA
jgi:signal transduction histidine kinase